MTVHNPGESPNIPLILAEVLGLDGDAMRGTDNAALASVLGALNTAEADGAVTDTDAAMACIKQIVTLAIHNEEAIDHTTAIFPAATNLTCTLTADVNANEWEDWVEIVDGAAATLSAAFAANAGHISALVVEETDQIATRFMVEISYGASKTIVSRQRVLTEDKKLPTTQVERCRGAEIPAGETIYARTMCATAGNKTLSVHFRYYLHT